MQINQELILDHLSSSQVYTVIYALFIIIPRSLIHSAEKSSGFTEESGSYRNIKSEINLTETILLKMSVLSHLDTKILVILVYGVHPVLEMT